MTPVVVDKKMLLESSAHNFTAEASELRWPPGYRPQMLQVDIGNGQPYMLDEVRTTEDRWVYFQIAGCVTITVFND